MLTESTLREIGGVVDVSDTPADLEQYSRDQSFVRGTRPRFVVRVRTAEAVQELVRRAKETGTPLVPVSSGGPHFFGDTVPSAGDAVVLDLSGMKEVDLIDRSERVVSVIRPGVTFGELIPLVAEKGMRLNVPLHPRSTKSVVGSMLSRDAVTMPHYHWDIGDPIGSMEVVFGTGDLFRTGAAAGPGGIEEQRAAGGRQKEAAGPSAASWHRLIQGAQGTMGIATWASAKCELTPSLEEPYFIGTDDLERLLQAAYRLVRLRLGNELFVVSAEEMATLVAHDPGTSGELVADLPEWILFFNLAAYDYLPEMRLRGQMEDAADLLQGLGLKTSQSLGGVGARRFLDIVRSPSDEPYWKLRLSGACQDILFLSTHKKIPSLVQVMKSLVGGAGGRGVRMGTYLQPVVQGAACHCEFSLFYSPDDAAGTKAVRRLAVEGIGPLMNAGAFFSRPFGEASRRIMNRDAATVEALRKVKAIVDPAGILNPGRLCF